MSVTADVSATRADLEFGDDARIGGVGAVTLLRGQVRLFDLELHALRSGLARVRLRGRQRLRRRISP